MADEEQSNLIAVLKQRDRCAWRAAVDRFERLVRFLEQERPQRRERLFAIPGAALGRAQRTHDIHQLLEPRADA